MGSSMQVALQYLTDHTTRADQLDLILAAARFTQLSRVSVCELR